MHVGLAVCVWGGGGGGGDSESNMLFCRKVAERKQRKVLFANFNFFYSITRKSKNVKGLSHSPKEILNHNGVSVFHRLHNYVHIYKHMYLFLKKKKKKKKKKIEKAD